MRKVNRITGSKRRFRFRDPSRASEVPAKTDPLGVKVRPNPATVSELSA
jgi:hypothetical protein